jgi:hypothetical protein
MSSPTRIFRLLFFLATTVIVGCLPPLRADLTPAQEPDAALFRTMRYGIFTTLTYQLTVSPDGQKSYRDFDDFVGQFDVNGYADEIKAMGVEYVIFTVWHKSIYMLGPNDALDKWLPGHTSSRDLIGEIADALNARGIKLILYAHPNDAHDLTHDEQASLGFSPDQQGLRPKYNDFINEVYADLATRYGKKPNVIGFWWDSWPLNNGCLDAARLRKTLLQAMPRAIVLSNNYDPAIVDFYSAECYFTNKPQDDIDGLVLGATNQTTIFAGQWWCDNLTSTSHYSAETLFRYTALNACTQAPGGMAWAVSPASDGTTYTKDLYDTMVKLNSYIQPVRESICGVSSWSDWPIPGGIVFSQAPAYGATRSLNGAQEYIHVVKPPQGNSLDLTEPQITPVADFTSARILKNNHPVNLQATPTGLSLTLNAGDSWDPLDTVIALTIKDPLDETVIKSGDPSNQWQGDWGQADVHHSSKAGDSAIIPFTGTKFVWIGVKGPDHGMATLVVDNQPPVQVDTYSPNRQDHTVCFTSADLMSGAHTIHITVGDKPNPASSGAWVEVEKILAVKPQ